MIKDVKFFKAFERIEKILRSEGHCVYTSATDGFGTVENNAAQLKSQIKRILERENAEKVNIIAHSKGGLDAKYFIEKLGGGTCVASLTTLCTPHRGSQIATKILSLPKPVVKMIALWLNFWYRIFGDKKPDALTVCRQLQASGGDGGIPALADIIYCQSYSATMSKSRDDFVMSIPLMFSKKFDACPTDGLVSTESAKFGNYRGDCIDGPLSHTEIIDFMAKKKKREKIYAFYTALCAELAEKGF